MNRREFLRVTGISLAGVMLAGRGFPVAAQEASDTELADVDNLNQALKESLGVTYNDLTPSDKVTLEAPSIAESGANVPVEIAASLPPNQVKALHVFIDRNPAPHIFAMSLGPVAAEAYFSTRVRVAESAPIRAIAETNDGQFLLASQDVRVTVGGCG